MGFNSSPWQKHYKKLREKKKRKRKRVKDKIKNKKRKKKRDIIISLSYSSEQRRKSNESPLRSTTKQAFASFQLTRNLSKDTASSCGYSEWHTFPQLGKSFADLDLQLSYPDPQIRWSSSWLGLLHYFVDQELSPSMDFLFWVFLIYLRICARLLQWKSHSSLWKTRNPPTMWLRSKGNISVYIERGALCIYGNLSWNGVCLITSAFIEDWRVGNGSGSEVIKEVVWWWNRACVSYVWVENNGGENTGWVGLRSVWCESQVLYIKELTEIYDLYSKNSTRALRVRLKFSIIAFLKSGNYHFLFPWLTTFYHIDY